MVEKIYIFFKKIEGCFLVYIVIKAKFTCGCFCFRFFCRNYFDLFSLQFSEDFLTSKYFERKMLIFVTYFLTVIFDGKILKKIISKCDFMKNTRDLFKCMKYTYNKKIWVIYRQTILANYRCSLIQVFFMMPNAVLEVKNHYFSYDGPNTFFCN